MGCHVSLPPQLVLELRRGDRLHTCGNCQRILVLAEHLVTAASAMPRISPSGRLRYPRA